MGLSLSGRSVHTPLTLVIAPHPPVFVFVFVFDIVIVFVSVFCLWRVFVAPGFQGPKGLAWSAQRNTLYVADFFGERIRAVTGAGGGSRGPSISLFCTRITTCYSE